MSWATQLQINATQGITFATALRSGMRQDPDVIFVGEIRDKETMLGCVQAALTGDGIRKATEGLTDVEEILRVFSGD